MAEFLNLCVFFPPYNVSGLLLVTSLFPKGGTIVQDCGVFHDHRSCFDFCAYFLCTWVCFGHCLLECTQEINRRVGGGVVWYLGIDGSWGWVGGIFRWDFFPLFVWAGFLLESRMLSVKSMPLQCPSIFLSTTFLISSLSTLNYGALSSKLWERNSGFFRLPCTAGEGEHTLINFSISSCRKDPWLSLSLSCASLQEEVMLIKFLLSNPVDPDSLLWVLEFLL